MKSIDFKSFIIGFLIATVAFLSIAGSKSGFLRVEKLEVVDENGNTVIKLGSADGNGTIETFNKHKNQIGGLFF